MKAGVKVGNDFWKEAFMAARTKVLLVGEQKVLCQNSIIDSLVMPIG